MKLLTILLLVIACPAFSQDIKYIETGTNSSFRGLSVVNDSVAWVSGSKGWVGITTDGGGNWKMLQVNGYEKYDFRSLHAFSSTTAIIANAGAPAYILRTEDAGTTWSLIYKNEDTAAFFDGTDFWDNKEGIIYGDPLKGRMMLMRTSDGGKTWKELPGPVLARGEASFAASGTTIRCMGKSKVVIATGGKVSRLWISEDKGNSWKSRKTPILQGESSQGIFSMVFVGDDAIIVGGDYKNDSLRKDHVFYTHNGGRHWKKPATSTGGYRECVAWSSSKIFIAVGPGGMDITDDGGKTWSTFSSEKGFHVIRRGPSRHFLVIAGSNGRIGVLKRD